jgi:hypothetical protein
MKWNFPVVVLGIITLVLLVLTILIIIGSIAGLAIVTGFGTVLFALLTLAAWRKW